MNFKIHLYNTIGYIISIILSILLGWVSTLGGEQNDFVRRMGNNLIPLLLTLMVLYSTLTIHLINELRKFNEKKEKDLSSVIRALRSNIVTELIIIIIAFSVLVCNNLIKTNFPNLVSYVEIASNSIIVFSFIYFLWVIIDATMGLYALIIDNINKQQS